MNFGPNIKYLRKEELRMSREEFGSLLGVSADTINNIELGRLARPEQKEPLFRLICQAFNVNYEWLATGNGEMRALTKQSIIEKLSAEYGLSDTAKKIMECYLSLDDTSRKAVDSLFESIAESMSNSN